jgi:hypothetical protein
MVLGELLIMVKEEDNRQRRSGVEYVHQAAATRAKSRQNAVISMLGRTI